MKRLLALAVVAACAAGAADARLVSQRVEGMRRICNYDVSTTHPGPARQLARSVPLGEPCPAFDPGERQPPQPQIPSMATFVGERRTPGGLHLCDYRYGGRNYTRAIPMANRCPLTPHFFD